MAQRKRPTTAAEKLKVTMPPTPAFEALWDALRAAQTESMTWHEKLAIDVARLAMLRGFLLGVTDTALLVGLSPETEDNVRYRDLMLAGLNAMKLPSPIEGPEQAIEDLLAVGVTLLRRPDVAKLLGGAREIPKFLRSSLASIVGHPVDVGDELLRDGLRALEQTGRPRQGHVGKNAALHRIYRAVGLEVQSGKSGAKRRQRARRKIKTPG